MALLSSSCEDDGSVERSCLFDTPCRVLFFGKVRKDQCYRGRCYALRFVCLAILHSGHFAQLAKLQQELLASNARRLSRLLSGGLSLLIWFAQALLP